MGAPRNSGVDCRTNRGVAYERRSYTHGSPTPLMTLSHLDDLAIVLGMTYEKIWRIAYVLNKLTARRNTLAYVVVRRGHKRIAYML